MVFLSLSDRLYDLHGEMENSVWQIRERLDNEASSRSNVEYGYKTMLSKRQVLETSAVAVREATLVFEETMRRLDEHGLHLSRMEATKARRQRWQLHVDVIRDLTQEAKFDGDEEMIEKNYSDISDEDTDTKIIDEGYGEKHDDCGNIQASQENKTKEPDVESTMSHKDTVTDSREIIYVQEEMFSDCSENQTCQEEKEADDDQTHEKLFIDSKEEDIQEFEGDITLHSSFHSKSSLTKSKEFESIETISAARAAETATAQEDLKMAQLTLGCEALRENKNSFDSFFSVLGISTTKPEMAWTPQYAVKEAFSEAIEEAAGWIHEQSIESELRWKRRWFVLKNHEDLGPFLEYSSEPGGCVVGRIMLAACDIRAIDSNIGSTNSPRTAATIDPMHSLSKTHLYEFIVTHPHQVRRQLGSVNRQTRKQWVSVLSQIIREHARADRLKDDELLLRASSSNSIDHSLRMKGALDNTSVSSAGASTFPSSFSDAIAQFDLDEYNENTRAPTSPRSIKDRGDLESQTRAKLNLRKAKIRLSLLYARGVADTGGTDELAK